LLSGGPPFIKYGSPDVIRINPGQLDVGSFKVTVFLSDGKLQNTYPLDITIGNTAPTFASSPIN